LPSAMLAWEVVLPLAVLVLEVVSQLFILDLAEAATRVSALHTAIITHMWITIDLESNLSVNVVIGSPNLSIFCIVWSIIHIVIYLTYAYMVIRLSSVKHRKNCKTPFRPTLIQAWVRLNTDSQNCLNFPKIGACFLATLVALHFTPVSE